MEGIGSFFFFLFHLTRLRSCTTHPHTHFPPTFTPYLGWAKPGARGKGSGSRCHSMVHIWWEGNDHREDYSAKQKCVRMCIRSYVCVYVYKCRHFLINIRCDTHLAQGWSQCVSGVWCVVCEVCEVCVCVWCEVCGVWCVGVCMDYRLQKYLSLFK